MIRMRIRVYALTSDTHWGVLIHFNGIFDFRIQEFTAVGMDKTTKELTTVLTAVIKALSLRQIYPKAKVSIIFKKEILGLIESYDGDDLYIASLADTIRSLLEGVGSVDTLPSKKLANPVDTFISLAKELSMDMV